MAKLSEFLQGGRLGPIVLGITTSEVLQLLGDPTRVSKKSNPALLNYGPLELTFWRKPSERVQRLRDILILFGQSDCCMPEAVDFTDWPVARLYRLHDFNAFIRRLGLSPIVAAKSISEVEQVFFSGVIASFTRQTLNSLRLVSNEVRQQTTMTVEDPQETPIEQIREMLNQANQAFNAGASSAALLMVWAAAEATLRRMAARSQIDRKVMLRPHLLIHHLRAERLLSADDAVLLEQLRQLRSAHAHGFPQSPIARKDVERLQDFVSKLLASLEASTWRKNI